MVYCNEPLVLSFGEGTGILGVRVKSVDIKKNISGEGEFPAKN